MDLTGKYRFIIDNGKCSENNKAPPVWLFSASLHEGDRRKKYIKKAWGHWVIYRSEMRESFTKALKM